MNQILKNFKWLAVASLFAFGAGAYAGTDDGNVGSNASQQTPASSSQQK
ncbi:MAG: hypothetical protein JWN73_3368 [Betaproteobacteria bacterium]|nr:hypothetical protein [Betaproteobacteria bacterium]